MLEEINKNIFTIFNYISIHLPYLGSDYEKSLLYKFDLVNYEIMKLISMERFIYSVQGVEGFEKKINPSINNVIIIKKEKKIFYKKRSFIYSLDLFSNTRTFLINSEKKFHTKWSYSLTALYYVGCIIIIYFFGQNIWNSKNPKINSLDIKLTDATDKSERNMTTLFKYSFSEKVAKSTKFMKWDYIKGAFKHFKYRTCTEEDLNQYNVNYPIGEKLVHYCVELPEVFDNIFADGALTDAELHFVNCTMLGHLGYTENDCVNDLLKPNDNFYFRLDYYSYTYDLTKKTDYIVKKLNSIDYWAIRDPKDVFHFTVKLFTKNLKDDKNMFVREIKQNYIITTNIFQMHFMNLNNRNTLCSTYLNFSTKYVEINRDYEKFTEFLSIIITLNSIYYILLYLIYFSICEYFFISHFKEEFYDNYSLPDSMKMKRLDDSQLNPLNLNENVESIRIDKHNKLKNIFNLKTFTINKFLFCCARKNNSDINYSDFYQKYKQFLSFESYLFKKNLNNQISYNNVMSLFDLKTEVKTLYTIGNLRKYKTFLGGLCSMIFIISIFPIFYIFGYDFWNKTNPEMNTINLPFSEIKGKYEYKFNIPLIYGYSKSIAQDMKEVYLTYIEKPPIIPYCTQQQLEGYYKEVEIESDMIYKCSNINKLIYDNLYDETNHMDHSIYTIQHKCIFPESKCKIPEEVYKVGFALNYTQFNSDLYENYFENTFVKVNMQKKYANFPYGAYYFSQNILLNDNNIFTNKMTTEYFTSSILKSIRNSGQWCPKEGCLEFRFFIADGLNIITRIYKKFPEMLIEVLSVITIFKILIKSICSVYSDYSYEKYITRKLLNFIEINYIKEENDVNEIDREKSAQRKITAKREIFDINHTFTNFIFGNYLKFIPLFKSNKSFEIYLQIRNEMFELTSLEILHKKLYAIKQNLPDEIVQRIEVNSNLHLKRFNVK